MVVWVRSAVPEDQAGSEVRAASGVRATAVAVATAGWAVRAAVAAVGVVAPASGSISRPTLIHSRNTHRAWR